ncbi:FAD/NAD(P)-binding protein [Corynebacterium oculi]|uniref:FAD-dependent urate hydroxylase HpyO/Asp monooxygenase CreE-like FAD/NAD(P)-binding domain-containing protein n=1 Tax=Corynebacterium oculi TaxID=1544416 RepID=A0A0Q1AAB6_9CORY|nr:FAD/NAD(P)-binding protein [Corynebacterium oculi]KQB83713.1 hypothetical protein Cocul_01785 [Corynebacterium oculi]
MTVRVAVIGAGVSAATIARRVFSTYSHIELTIFDATPPQKHLAFGQVDERMLCNTSTSVMSIDAEDPQDFARFLGCGTLESSSIFPAREKYGHYLQQALLREVSTSRDCLRFIPDSVVCVEDSTDPIIIIHTGHHGFFKADFVVITGNQRVPRIPPSCRSYRGAAPVFSSPYDPGFLAWLKVHPASRIGILGTGLSAVDAARLALFEGVKAVMLSPSGQLPGVRTSLQINAPSEISSSEFRSHSHSVEDFRKYATWCANSLGWNPGRLREYICKNGTDRFLLDYELAENGYSVWEKMIGRMVDLANQIWSPLIAPLRCALLNGIADWIRHYVTAMPVQSAKTLQEGFHTGSLMLACGEGIGEQARNAVDLKDTSGNSYRVEAVVCACGYENLGWVRQGEGVFPGQIKPNVSRWAGTPLNNGWGSARVGGRVLFAGEAAALTTAIPSYARTSVMQAVSVIDWINSET